MNTTDQSRLEKLAIAFATMQGHTPAEAASFAEFVDAACVQLGVNKADYERELAKARGPRSTAGIKSYGTVLPLAPWFEHCLDSPSAESAKIGDELTVTMVFDDRPMAKPKAPAGRSILDMIAEWRNGCSCAEPGHPEQCEACTVGLIEAIERKSKAMGAGDE